MSTPKTDYDCPVYGTVMELSSARSALCMEAEPLPAEEIEEGRFYLSETDKWAKHAYEHLIAASKNLSQASLDKKDFARKIYKILVSPNDKTDIDELNAQLLEIYKVVAEELSRTPF